MVKRKEKPERASKGKRMTIFKKLQRDEPPPEPVKPQEAVPGFVKVGEAPKPVESVPTPKVEEPAPVPKAKPMSSKVHEGKSYYCVECGSVLLYGYSPFRLIHPDYSCSYSYVEVDPPQSDVLELSVSKKG